MIQSDPTYQFGFKENHSTIEQVYKIENVVENSLKEKVCSTTFPDMEQAFEKV